MLTVVKEVQTSFFMRSMIGLFTKCVHGVTYFLHVGRYIHVVPLDMKGCICHFTKWQIHPFITMRAMYGQKTSYEYRFDIY